MKKNLLRLLAAFLAAALLLTGCAFSVPVDEEAVDELLDFIDSQLMSEETDLPDWEELPEETTLAPPETEADEAEAAPETETETVPEAEAPEQISSAITENGSYTSKEEVALYLHQFGHLPGNYITKKEAQDLGWVNKDGNLWKVAPGKSIGGDRFGNYEGLLPEAKGRKYTECDIDFDGGYRNSKRIIFSNDGLIYYTEDHYETFELLYGRDDT